MGTKIQTSMSRILRFDIRSHRGEPSLLYPLKPNPAALLIASAAGQRYMGFRVERLQYRMTRASLPAVCKVVTETNGALDAFV